MSAQNLHEDTALFRRFNRFYTKQIGLLTQGLLKTRFPLIQARVLYEMAQQQQTTASALVEKLNIDPGYLSRILSNFEKEGLLRKHRSTADSRKRILKLTNPGKKSFAELDERSRSVAEEMLLGLVDEDRHRLLLAMQTIETILDTQPKPSTPYLLRPHRGPAISAGSSTGTASSMPKNMGLMKPSKPWLQKSWCNSFTSMTPSGNAFGSLSRRANGSARS